MLLEERAWSVCTRVVRTFWETDPLTFDLWVVAICRMWIWSQQSTLIQWSRSGCQRPWSICGCCLVKTACFLYQKWSSTQKHIPSECLSMRLDSYDSLREIVLNLQTLCVTFVRRWKSSYGIAVLQLWEHFSPWHQIAPLQLLQIWRSSASAIFACFSISTL